MAMVAIWKVARKKSPFAHLTYFPPMSNIQMRNSHSASLILSFCVCVCVSMCTGAFFFLLIIHARKFSFLPCSFVHCPSGMCFWTKNEWKKNIQNAQAFSEISGIITMFYVVRALSPYTEYEFYVIAVNNIGRGPPSIPATTTTGETGKNGFYFLLSPFATSSSSQHNVNCVMNSALHIYSLIGFI